VITERRKRKGTHAAKTVTEKVLYCRWTLYDESGTKARKKSDISRYAIKKDRLGAALGGARRGRKSLEKGKRRLNRPQREQALNQRRKGKNPFTDHMAKQKERVNDKRGKMLKKFSII